MLTFTLQCIGAALLVVASLLCLRAGSLPSPNAFHRAAWKLVGVGLLIHSSDLVVQNVFGGLAIHAGNDSALMEAYLQWLPVMNHSRTFLLDGLLVGLIVLSVYRRQPDLRFWITAGALIAIGFAAGVMIGSREGRFTIAGHFSAVAVWDVAELLLLFAAMLALLLSNRADRALWALLAAYGTTLALGVFWFAVLVQLGLGTWTPPIWAVHAQRIFFHALMVAAALWRVTRGTPSRPIPGMLDRGLSSAVKLH